MDECYCATRCISSLILDVRMDLVDQFYMDHRTILILCVSIIYSYISDCDLFKHFFVIIIIVLSIDNSPGYSS